MSRRKPDFKIDAMPSSEQYLKQHYNHQQTAASAKPKEPILNKSSAAADTSSGGAAATQGLAGLLSSAAANVQNPLSHQKQPSVHAHFNLDEVAGHSGSVSRSGSSSDNRPVGLDDQRRKEETLGGGAGGGVGGGSVGVGGTGGTTSILSPLHQQTVEPLQPLPPLTAPSGMPSVSSGDPRLPENDGKKHILLGATGSVSTSKLRMIIHKLEDIYGKDKVSIQIILTKSAEGFIKPSEIPPGVIVWHDEDEWKTWKGRADPVVHIELRRWADILVIAPLTANTLGKIALGLCDNLLTNVVRAWNTAYPILIAPAMLSYAYNHPATKRHLKVLKEDMKWIEILKPTEKVVGTFGDIGMGGMMDWNEIVDKIVMKLGGYPEIEDDEDDDDDEEQKDLEQPDSEVEENDDDDEEDTAEQVRKMKIAEANDRRGSM